MTREPLDVRRRDGVVMLTLNRPHRLNAMTPEFCDALSGALGAVDASALAVVLRGAGRAFCAGYDLKEAEARGVPDEHRARDGVERMQRVTRALRACPAPVVAVVHGYALGGGAEIALSCDLVIAARGAVFGFPETGVGLCVTSGVTGLLAKVVGPARAKELILLGEEFGAAEAAELGLVNRVVDDDRLDEELEQVLARLRTRVPLAVRLAKRLVDDNLDADLEGALAAEVEAVVEAETSPAARAAISSFARRRP